ncbi:MAG TPA: glutamate synthase-related protein [Syntrophorhabdaceae bacterium]|nr:glutamate synthase-related protein [Syntrophorhabdaceae bacterium]HON86267.1 glutamate synthase-related protein [Syntrophorhabdaceae bacterium]HPC67566.1 glutamate synthase-related protein [Syntrophorhabdaceae bacterium]HQE80785.1 glutamate synthase-related protein [Syntrophorhabdaceae bacterium]HQH44027.1 glutamate synthase-related protein [Syntrophorhabdaceae bacterium]
MIEWPKSNDAIGTVNRGNPAESGLCTLCRADCKGRCETWLSSLKGRKILYPRDFGTVTAGSSNTCHIGVSYNSLRIQGYNYGAYGLPNGLSSSPDDCIFPNVNIETAFGNEVKTRCRMPIMTGALGSTFIAAKYWDSFAIGAALIGIPIVVGENVVGVDREAVIKDGKIVKAPELDRRIETYLRYFDGYGAIIVQMNVEDTRNGVAEYVINKYGEKVIIELKWGQGAKDIGGEIQVDSLGYALFLKDRGYVVDPDPTKPEVQKAFENGALKAFARHSRLGYTDMASPEAVRENFMESVAYLRNIGFKRISLKTGSYGMEALAMAIKFASDAGLDLLTVDGSGGGTGMSPWNMMETWGVPSILLHSKTYEYASILASRGERVVDIAFAGGLAREDHIFKALALGAPFTKLICMGRAVMIPGFVGSNIEGVLRPERRKIVNGNWDDLAPAVKELGSTPEEIFAGYYDVQKKLGEDEMKNIPFGAIAMWTLADKLAAGLQQLMAGARKFSLPEISRNDIFSGNRETEKETKIPFITDVLDEQAKNILNTDYKVSSQKVGAR